MKSGLMYVMSNEAAAEQALGQLLKLLQAQFTEQTTVSATSLDVFVDPSCSPCCDKDRILTVRVKYRVNVYRYNGLVLSLSDFLGLAFLFYTDKMYNSVTQCHKMTVSALIICRSVCLCLFLLGAAQKQKYRHANSCFSAPVKASHLLTLSRTITASAVICFKLN